VLDEVNSGSHGDNVVERIASLNKTWTNQWQVHLNHPNFGMLTIFFGFTMVYHITIYIYVCMYSHLMKLPSQTDPVSTSLDQRNRPHWSGASPVLSSAMAWWILYGRTVESSPSEFASFQSIANAQIARPTMP
jgi:hypothetical protein